MSTHPIQSPFFDQVANLTEMLDALNRIPGAMFMVKNRESRYIYMSRALREAIQIQLPEEVVGKTDYELFLE